MGSVLPVPEFAAARFGKNADTLARLLVDALVESYDLAMDAHRSGRQTTFHAYGMARYHGQFDRFADFIGGGIDGAKVFRPQGCSYHLVRVGTGVLYPFRFAQDANADVRRARMARRAAKSTLALFERFGTSPHWAQDELFEDDDATTVHAQDHVPEGTGIVLVPYAMSSGGGLLSAHWGEGALYADGSVSWAGADGPARLSLPALSADGTRQRLYAVGGADPAASSKPFDRQAEPDLEFPVQAPGSVPSSENDLTEPEAEGYGQP